MEATVVIGTFGHHRWPRLAEERAVPSVPEGVPVIHEHRNTLAQARNAALEQVETEWVCGLDADDELTPGYFTEMAKGSAEMRVPAVQYLRRGVEWGETRVPRVWGHDHQCVGECLRHGNWMCIGTMVKTELAVPWEEFGWSEDWAFFARIWKNGATCEAIPSAIYRAHSSGRGRNRVQRHVGVRWHEEIERAVWPEEPSIL